MVVLMLLAFGAKAGDVEGLVVKKSPFNATKTIDRLENVLKEKGINVATRWSHHEGARDVGISLRPTELIIFGNPEVGSHFFTSAQTAGIDLPMKALAWRDADGQVWLGYNDPQYIADRHGIDDRDAIIEKMTGALDNLTDAAIAR
ncbi:DUF302 domain-containing protein [Thiohalorhabdus sp.]|uniref:DUF302 domain-containing protein n=1 Tax=Thiohalorhabdus sp. TaxID=3094134 RepID=UPI003FCE6617